MSTPARKFVFPEELWAGTEHSLSVAMDAHEQIMAGVFGGQSQTSDEDDEDKKPYSFSQQGDVGVVTIRGPLVNRDSPYNQFAGVTSYSEIRRAMVYGATQPGVKAILLDIDSGGGAVSGCADCADLISMVDSGIKPVYAFSGGTMASAAQWLGLAAGSSYVSMSTISGSIGVIATHMEFSKALKEAGIGVKVFRAGEFKALASSFEPLTAVAEKQIQDQLNAAYNLFIGFAAERRGVSVALADSTFGQGREFFGGAAVDVGLADGLKNFDGMMSMINAKVIDTSAKRDNTPSHYQRGPNMSRQALTEQQIAAIAAGAAATAGEPDAAAVAAAAVDAAAALEASAAAAAADTKAPEGNAALVGYLQSQVKEKDAALVALGVEINGLKAKAATVEATHAGLVKIAASSLANMKVGMGLAKADYSAMTPELLLAEHASTSASFTAAFKVGGVAAVEAPAAKDEAKSPDHMHAARIAATRFSAATK